MPDFASPVPMTSQEPSVETASRTDLAVPECRRAEDSQGGGSATCEGLMTPAASPTSCTAYLQGMFGVAAVAIPTVERLALLAEALS